MDGCIHWLPLCHTVLVFLFVRFPASTASTSNDDSPKNAVSQKSDSANTKLVTGMRLNDHKAGMEGLDKEKINAIIHEASKGTTVKHINHSTLPLTRCLKF